MFSSFHFIWCLQAWNIHSVPMVTRRERERVRGGGETQNAWSRRFVADVVIVCYNSKAHENQTQPTQTSIHFAFVSAGTQEKPTRETYELGESTRKWTKRHTRNSQCLCLCLSACLLASIAHRDHNVHKVITIRPKLNNNGIVFDDERLRWGKKGQTSRK